MKEGTLYGMSFALNGEVKAYDKTEERVILVIANSLESALEKGKTEFENEKNYGDWRVVSISEHRFTQPDSFKLSSEKRRVKVLYE